MRFVTNGVSFERLATAQQRRGILDLGLQAHLELVEVLGHNIGADFLPIDHVGRWPPEKSHGPGPVALVVSTIDLLRGQAQSRQHRLRGFDHPEKMPGSVCRVSWIVGAVRW